MTIFLALIVILMGGCWLLRRPLLRAAAQVWMVENDSFQEVDAIFIPGGGIQTRPFEAARMFHDGIGPQIVTFEVQASPSEKIGVTQPEHELTRSILSELDVPLSAVTVIGEGVDSSWGEVQASRSWCEQNAIESIVVLTDIFPSRRVRWAWKKGFEGQETRLYFRAVDPPNYSEDDWWLHENGLISFQNELIKYVYYRVRF